MKTKSQLRITKRESKDDWEYCEIFVRPVVDVVDGVRSSRQSEEGFGFGEWRTAIGAAAVAIEGARPGDRA